LLTRITGWACSGIWFRPGSEYCAAPLLFALLGLRRLKDTGTWRLNSLFGTVEVPALRFTPMCSTRSQ
jgi:hypothetical protein